MPASKYFSDIDLACRHCRVNGTTQALRDALDAFRVAARVPVIVDDAYRCPEHNRAVGGTPDSQHVMGIAADIRVPGLKAYQLVSIATSIAAINGIGRDDFKNYIHVDTRVTHARWCYDSSGKWVSWFPYIARPAVPAVVDSERASS